MSGDAVSGQLMELDRQVLGPPPTRVAYNVRDRTRQMAAVVVAASSLETTSSLRVNGESAEHVELLVESDADLPPLLVHRSTMRVLDGVHRLRALQLRGHREVAVEFFDGDEDEAFIEAVRVNLTNGLPLSLADRRAAARRILDRYPEWSDRVVAKTTGLSADTISVVRQQASGDLDQPNGRIGRDGRVRPVDPGVGRRRAAELLVAQPSASLRQVARQAGIAVGTVRNVRERMRRGESPVLTRRPNSPAQAPTQPARDKPSRADRVDFSNTLQTLRSDPSLKFNEAGRRLLRWLQVHSLIPDEQAWAVSAVPPHWANRIAALARANAAFWQEYADLLELRARPEEVGSDRVDGVSTIGSRQLNARSRALQDVEGAT